MVNRTLAFIVKYFDGRVPKSDVELQIDGQIINLFKDVGNKIEQGNFKDAIDEIFEFVRYGNKYFDAEKPWVTRNSDLVACGKTIFNCVHIIANLSILLNPFIPFSSQKVCSWLGINTSWKPQFVENELIIPEPEILFERIDKKVIEEELIKLK